MMHQATLVTPRLYRDASAAQHQQKQHVEWHKTGKYSNKCYILADSFCLSESIIYKKKWIPAIGLIKLKNPLSVRSTLLHHHHCWLLSLTLCRRTLAFPDRAVCLLAHGYESLNQDSVVRKTASNRDFSLPQKKRLMQKRCIHCRGRKSIHTQKAIICKPELQKKLLMFWPLKLEEFLLVSA